MNCINMIKYFFSIILLFAASSTSCIGQEIECQYAPSNRFTGKCESFYTNGNIRSETDFINGLRHGNHREYYKNGRIAASTEFFEESYIGKVLRFSPDSILIFEMELDTNETGKFVHYSDDGTQILTTGQFKSSYRDGKWKFFNDSGELIDVKKYDSDKTRQEIYGDGTSRDIFIPYDETIDNLFLEEYGLPIEIRPETIIDSPDIDAEFPNGTEEMKKFIRKNVKYPISALKKNQEGKVYISFIVELDGSISNQSILRGVCESLDQEAMRLVKSMPNWNPGMYIGQEVRTKVYLPITFIIQTSDD